MSFPLPEKIGFTVYSKSDCIFCTRAKNILQNQRDPMTLINCDVFLETNRDGFLAFIHNLSGKSHRTFPVVFYDGAYIGGFTELKMHLDTVDKDRAFDSVFF
jgi:glutaredoxin